MTAILAIIDPALFQTALFCLRKLEQMTDDPSFLEIWPLVFNGVLVIANRWIRPHQDHGSKAHWPDILATIGNYPHAEFTLYNLGVRLSYMPGSIMVLWGKVVQHSVPPCDPDRVCYALWMKSAIHDRVEPPETLWAEVGDIEPL